MSAEFRGRSYGGTQASAGPARSSSSARTQTGGSRGSGGGKGTQRLDDQLDDNLDNSPHEAEPEVPPGLKLSIGLCELVFGGATNIVQVTTSTIAFMSMAIGAAVRFTNFFDLFHLFTYAFTIAFVIALAIQLFLHKNAQSMSGTYRRMRQIQHFNVLSTHSLQDVKGTITIGTVYFLLALIGDIVSDATFVNLYTHNPFIIGGWIIFLTGSSTLLMYDGATRIWGAFEDFKDYRAYHRKHDPE